MKLTIKKQYLYEDGKPFFWLGDTAWELLSKLDMSDILVYLRNRKELGFNVIQTILCFNFLDEYEDEDYFKKVLDVIRQAKNLGIYIALFPLWGRYLKNAILDEGQINSYFDFIIDYFKEEENLIWVLGGDIRGDFNFDFFNSLGEKLKKNNPERLVTFHPFGRTGSYLWFNNCKWLDFNMFQSGHRRDDQLNVKAQDDNYLDDANFGESNYKYVIKSLSYKPLKPCLDAEPSYEGVVQGLHDISQPYWEAYHIRRYAYFGVLEGACGFSYGNNAVIQFYDGKGFGSYGVRETWKEAIHAPGGAELKILKDLFYEFDFTKGLPHPELVLMQGAMTDRISCFAGDNYLICYTYVGNEIVLNFDNYKNKNMAAYWVNPENGFKSYIGTYNNKTKLAFKPVRRRELSNDWVLILREE